MSIFEKLRERPLLKRFRGQEAEPYFEWTGVTKAEVDFENDIVTAYTAEGVKTRKNVEMVYIHSMKSAECNLWQTPKKTVVEFINGIVSGEATEVEMREA